MQLAPDVLFSQKLRHCVTFQLLENMTQKKVISFHDTILERTACLTQNILIIPEHISLCLSLKKATLMYNWLTPLEKYRLSYSFLFVWTTKSVAKFTLSKFGGALHHVKSAC